MATSVKMRDEDKQRLDRLQGELQALRGYRVPLQELMARIVTLAEGHKELLFEDAARPMTEKEIAAMRRLCVRTGIPTREEDIDDIIAEEAR